MRIICKVFDDGSRQIYETSHDGKKICRVLEGDDPRTRTLQVRRISAFIEVGCDDNRPGQEGVKQALNQLSEVLQSTN